MRKSKITEYKDTVTDEILFLDYLTYKAKMKEIIDVNTGEVKLGTGKIILRSIAIGSCIVIAAYDLKKKIAAMAHIMLPGRAPSKTPEKTKYAVDAIDEMIHTMTQTGSDKCDIEACLVGGGNVLKKKDDTICRDNIESATQLLEKKHIPVRATALVGTKSKGVFLDVETGSVTYTEADGKEKLLWKPAGNVTSK